jgi:hypothetical protein
MPDQDELDEMLHSALNTYGDPGPDSDLAGRVLARVAAANMQRPSRRWLPWAIALPVAAGVLILVTLFTSRPSSRPADHIDQAHVLQPQPAHASRSIASAISTPNRRTRVARAKAHDALVAATPLRLQKRDVFPTPQPLTPAEQALADYATHASPADRQALIETQQKIEEPLSIAAIQIQPLAPPDQSGN